MERLTKEQMIAQPLEALEREWHAADRYPSIARAVDDAMADIDLVHVACKALPHLLEDPDDSVSYCDVDGGCDRIQLAHEIAFRLRRMRARMAP